MKKRFIAVIITLVFIFLVFRNINLQEMGKTLSEFDLKMLYAIVPIFLGAMFVRAYRWFSILPQNTCKTWDMFGIYMTSALMNIILPARAGDLFRGVYFGQKYNISKMSAIGTVAAERIIDGLTVVFILLLGMLLYNITEFTIKLAIAASILFFGSFIFMLWVYKTDKINTICEIIKKNSKVLPQKPEEFICKFIDKLNPFLNSFMRGFSAFNNVKIMMKVVFLSFITWFGEVAFSYLLILGFNVEIPLPVVFLVVSFVALSTIIPSTSVYLGPYQYAFIVVLGFIGISKNTALTMALTQQFVMLLTILAIAVIYILQNNLSISEIKKEAVEK